MKKSDEKRAKPVASEADILTAETVDVTDATLELTPPRILKFLRGVGTRPAIRYLLASVGYDDAEHAQGWERLHAVSGYTAKPELTSPLDPNVSGAISLLDAEDERLETRIDASLRHRYPAVRALLLDGIKSGQGAASVIFVRELLKRLNTLEATKGAGAADAKAALGILAARGITPQKRAELASLVTTAESLTQLVAPTTTEGESADTRAKLLAARAWFEEWSEIAKSELKRKDYLIVLGLAQRKSPKKPGDKGGDKKPTD